MSCSTLGISLWLPCMFCWYLFALNRDSAVPVNIIGMAALFYASVMIQMRTLVLNLSRMSSRSSSYARYTLAHDVVSDHTMQARKPFILHPRVDVFILGFLWISLYLRVSFISCNSYWCSTIFLLQAGDAVVGSVWCSFVVSDNVEHCYPISGWRSGLWTVSLILGLGIGWLSLSLHFCSGVLFWVFASAFTYAVLYSK